MEYLHKEDDVPKYLFVKRTYPSPHIDVYPVIVSTLSGFAFNDNPSHSFGYRITDTHTTEEIFTGLCDAWLESQNENLD